MSVLTLLHMHLWHRRVPSGNAIARCNTNVCMCKQCAYRCERSSRQTAHLIKRSRGSLRMWEQVRAIARVTRVGQRKHAYGCMTHAYALRVQGMVCTNTSSRTIACHQHSNAHNTTNTDTMCISCSSLANVPLHRNEQLPNAHTVPVSIIAK